MAVTGQQRDQTYDYGQIFEMTAMSLLCLPSISASGCERGTYIHNAFQRHKLGAHPPESYVGAMQVKDKPEPN